jgi:hypothetical protein
MINALTAMLASKRAPIIMAARMAFLDSHSKWGCPSRTTVGANTTILHLFQIAIIDLTRTLVGATYEIESETGATV